MRPRKRFYATAHGHAAGIDVHVRAPDRSVYCTVMGLAGTPNAPGGEEEARAKGRLIVEALNAHAKTKELIAPRHGA